MKVSKEIESRCLLMNRLALNNLERIERRASGVMVLANVARSALGLIDLVEALGPNERPRGDSAPQGSITVSNVPFRALDIGAQESVRATPREDVASPAGEQRRS